MALSRKQAAKVAGIASWERNRLRKLFDSHRGGQTTRSRYGRSHFVALAFRRWALARAGEEPREAPAMKLKARPKRRELPPCPRCQAETYLDYDGDIACFACGWRDLNLPAPPVPQEELLRRRRYPQSRGVRL